jgi:hypothetical protein
VGFENELSHILDQRRVGIGVSNAKSSSQIQSAPPLPQAVENQCPVCFKRISGTLEELTVHIEHCLQNKTEVVDLT